MNKSSKLKSGVLLTVIIAAIAYIVDDYFYYSDMKMAEIFVMPVALVIIAVIAVYMIIPYFQRR